MGLDVISIHIFLSLNDILQEHFFLHNGGLICILNIRGTFFGNVNKQIQFLHIFPFPMIPIRKKNKGGARGPYLRTFKITQWYACISLNLHVVAVVKWLVKKLLWVVFSPGHLDLSRCPLLNKSLQPTDIQGSDTTWELRMSPGMCSKS